MSTDDSARETASGSPLGTGGTRTMKDLQDLALQHPIAVPEQAFHDRHFRRLAGGWVVGLTANK